MTITAPGFPRPIATAIIPGGAAGDHKLPGWAPKSSDSLISVTHISADLVTRQDLTAEFSIIDAGTIDNTAGTDTAGNFLVATWRSEV